MTTRRCHLQKKIYSIHKYQEKICWFQEYYITLEVHLFQSKPEPLQNNISTTVGLKHIFYHRTSLFIILAQILRTKIFWIQSVL